MEVIYNLFGTGKDLDALQMGARAIIIFILALILIRVSGRRSFGLHTAFDNIIVVLLGAILSRGVVGASPFIPIVIACLIIVVLHRFFGWLIARYKFFGTLVEGKKILVFQDGKFIKKNLVRALSSEEDIMQGVRKDSMTDNIAKIDRIYMERSGEVSVIEKEKL